MSVESTRLDPPVQAGIANDRFLKACRGLPVDRSPVWIMRQAGRYLPEYRELRRKADFLTFCKTPDLVAEAAAVAAEILSVDAAILFSDILIPLEAMGMKLIFEEPGGPKLPEPIRDRGDLARYRVPDPGESLCFVQDAIQKTRERLAGRIPLIGFAGAPFTLAAYAVDGGGSRNHERTLAWLHRDPAGFGELLDLLTRVVMASLRAQVSAGVHAVQIFDTWGGYLSRDDYRRFAVPRLRSIVDALKATRVPVILYVNDSSHLLEAMAETGADVLSVDWRLPLDEVRRRVGPGPALQGNIDPCVLLAGEEIVMKVTRETLNKGGGRGHILNLGHGILPGTPVAGALAMVRACHEWAPGGGA